MTTATDAPRLLLIAALLLPLSNVQAGGSHAHDTGAAAHADAHAEEPAPVVYTHYTDATELFVEFPPLQAGKPSHFAAHVTRLSDFTPLTQGIMEVEFRRDGHLHAGFRVREPARPGIFAPQVTVSTPGHYDLRVRVKDGDWHDVHELGEIEVTAADQPPATPATTDEGDIRYLKEQQWQNPFASARVDLRPLRAAVPGFATVVAPGDGSASVRAPSDGYFSGPGVPATATGVYVPGQTVAQEAVLGYLVPRLGEGTDLGSLRLDNERARARLTLAERDLERVEALVKQGAIPERRVLEARQEREVARVELETTQSRLQLRSGKGGAAGIALKSPLTAELVAVKVRPGAFVRADELLFTLVDAHRRWIEIQIPEKFAAALATAHGAWLQPSEPGASPIMLDPSSGARILSIDGVIEPRTRTLTVTLEYPVGEGVPKALGARFPAYLQYGGASPTLAVARTAVIDDGGQPVVYVQTGGESFVRRPVTLGIQDGAWVQVLTGVTEGERVVSEGAYFVKLAAAGGDEIGHGHAH